MFNARSVCNKWYDICHLADEYSAGIIAITETWLKNDYDPAVFVYRDYMKYTASRKHKIGGGVMCLLKPVYKITELVLPDVFPSSCDGLALKIDNMSALIILVYRPPSCSNEDTANLFRALEELLSLGLNTSILGDFNIPHICWQSDPYTAFSSLGFDLLQLVSAWDLIQLVPGPTRGDNQLDIILVTSSTLLSNCHLGPPVATSDHCVIFCDFVLPPRRRPAFSNSQPCYDFAKTDYVKMAHLLRAIDWSSLFYSCIDIDVLWSLFESIMQNTIALCVPRISNHSNSNPVQRHRALFLRKKRRWRRWKRKPTMENKIRFKQAANQLSLAIKRRHKLIENNLLRKSSSHFFRYVSFRLSHQTNSINLRTISGDMVDEASVICNLLCEEFTKNFSMPTETFAKYSSSIDSVFQVQLDSYTVLKTLQSLPMAAAGPDGIPAVIYRHMAASLVQPLTHLFQQSLFQGRLPAEWKKAKVIPIFKGKEEKSSPSSYRPISLTNNACKILERIVSAQLSDYLERNNILSQCQHGFRRGKSAATNILHCDTYISECLNAGSSCDLFLFDFERAFDKIDHNILCCKLERIGIDGCYLRWFADFLANRWQYVEYQGEQSKVVPVSSGVIQGSVVGPNLFNIYINDITNCVKYCKLQLFADDMKAAGEIHDSASLSLIQQDIDSIERWSIENKLPISLPKTVCLHYGKKNPRHFYNLQNAPISVVSSCTDLGVQRNDMLSYDDHTRAMALSASRLMYMCSKVFSTHQPKFLINVYKSFIRPKLEYASVVWSPHSATVNAIVENVQRRFTKRINGIAYLSYEARIRHLQLPSLLQRRVYLDLIFIYKCLHQLTAISVNSLGLSVISSTTRGNGIRLNYFIPKTLLLSTSFRCRAAQAWNTLPTTIVTLPTLSKFKVALKRHLNMPL